MVCVREAPYQPHRMMQAKVASCAGCSRLLALEFACDVDQTESGVLQQESVSELGGCMCSIDECNANGFVYAGTESFAHQRFK